MNRVQGNIIQIPTVAEIEELLEQKLAKLVRELKEDRVQEDELLDTDGVRLLLGGGNGKMCSKGKVDQLRKEGILPFFKLGSGRNALVRFKKSEVLAAMEGCRRG